jgi:hypothetical protein
MCAQSARWHASLTRARRGRQKRITPRARSPQSSPVCGDERKDLEHPGVHCSAFHIWSATNLRWSVGFVGLS